MARAPQHPSAFPDIGPILDAALAAGGGAYRPPGDSPQAAIKWRHRAYSFRRAVRHQAQQAGGPFDFDITTPYDGVVLTIEDGDPTTVLINKAPPIGRLTTLDGAPLEPVRAAAETPSLVEDDPLLEQARQQAQELGFNLED